MSPSDLEFASIAVGYFVAFLLVPMSGQLVIYEAKRYKTPPGRPVDYRYLPPRKPATSGKSRRATRQPPEKP